MKDKFIPLGFIRMKKDTGIQYGTHWTSAFVGDMGFCSLTEIRCIVSTEKRVSPVLFRIESNDFSGISRVNVLVSPDKYSELFMEERVKVEIPIQMVPQANFTFTVEWQGEGSDNVTATAVLTISDSKGLGT